MRVDVLNGSNDTSSCHPTEEVQANKAASVTNASELEQYYSRNTTAMMPMADNSNDDNNSHKFVETSFGKGIKEIIEMTNALILLFKP